MSLKNIVQEYYENGKKVEGDFAKDLLNESGGELRCVGKDEDVFKHIDVRWLSEKDSREHTFDIKGARKKDRGDEFVSWDSTWLEFKNVNGNNGSLLGDEEFMVFEAENEWLITKREKLLEAAMSKITDDTLYVENPRQYFKKYQRAKWGRKDEIVLVPISFIEELTVKRIPKTF